MKTKIEIIDDHVKKSTIVYSYLIKVMGWTNLVQLILNDQKRELIELLSTLRSN